MPPTYRPEIDGLRALAVLPVIAFHAGFSGFSGGFVGVDVFFVISGYLITGILAADLREGRYSIARFYERRARRILPALFVMLAASVLAAQVLLLPPPFEDFSASVFTVVLFLSNMLFLSEVDYFAPAAEETPLLHTWSLAVEEQFYILFPLILRVLWRSGRERALFWGVLVVTLGSFAFSEYAWRSISPAQSFYFLPSRAWELGAGALCALWQPRRLPMALRQGLGLAGLAAIGLSVVALNREMPFPSAWALLPVGGAVAVILFATQDTLAARLLSLRAVVAIGLVSYSAYLWHHPLFVFARLALDTAPSPLLMLGLSLLSLALAALSWRFVEQPFRAAPGRAARLPRRAQVYGASLAGIAAFAAFGLWGYLTEGRAELWLRSASPEQRQTFALLAPAAERVQHLDDGGCRFNQRTITPQVRTRIEACHALHGPGLAVIGDSHALNLADALILNQSAPFLVGVTQGACRPDSPRDECGYDGFVALVADSPQLFARVVFEVAGQHLIEGPGGRRTGKLFSLYAHDTPIPDGDITLLDDRIRRNADFLRGLAQHVPVLWLTPRVEVHIRTADIMALGCNHPFALRPGQAQIFQRLARAIEAEIGTGSGVGVLDQGPLMHLTLPQDFLTCEALHWRDGDHLSGSGLAWLGARLGPHLAP